MAKIIGLTPVYDRSRVVQDWKCPRSRYWGYEAYGKGIAPLSTSLELFTGITVHDSLSSIAEATKSGSTPDIDDIAGRASQQMLESLLEVAGDDPEKIEFAHEQAALVEGMLRGFNKHVWPRLIARYPFIHCIEQEMEYPHDGLIFMSKPDLIMGNDEETVYIEYKTTSSKKEGWVNSWDTAVQLHSTIKAVKATTGIDVDSVIVQGLYKGYESYGKQNSPFCYAYKRNGNPPFTTDAISYEYKPGFKRSPTWEMDGGVKAWVESMPEMVLAALFPQTAPIFINEDLVNSFFRQRATREKEIADFVPYQNNDGTPRGMFELEAGDPAWAELDRVFPQRFDQCTPSFGRPCQFKRICHGEVTEPLLQGFVERVPHHAKEMDQFDGD